MMRVAEVIPPQRIGKEGRLHLLLRRDGSSPKTTLRWQRAEPPLAVQRALYCEDGLPDMAYIYISSTSGGLLRGDRHVIKFDMGRCTKAHITTQGATRIYGTGHASRRTADRQPTTQTLQISLDDKAYLEYMPDPMIPYANSEFLQDAAISVHDTATMVYAETVSSGRIGMGESFAYESCSLKTRITDQNGKFRFADAARMIPAESGASDIRSFGVMGGYKIVSSLYVLTKKEYTAELQDGMNNIISQSHAITGGASVMSGSTGVLARLLGHDTESVKNVTDEAAAFVRKAVLGAQFTRVRKS